MTNKGKGGAGTYSLRKKGNDTVESFHLKTSGEIVPVTPISNSTFTLDELQGFVKGYIELIHLGEGAILVVDEEALIKTAPIKNKNASIKAGFPVFGDVLLTLNKYID